MHWLSRKRNILMMLIPTLMIYLVYMIIPIAIAIGYSFTKYTGIGKAKIVGFNNYMRLFRDHTFWIALKNTAVIFVIAFVLLMIGAFVVALLLNLNLKGKSFAQSLIFSPAVIAPIIVGILWVFILDPQIGLINAIIRSLGFGQGIKWIGGKTLTPVSVAIVYFWQQLGYLATIYLAGLKMIPVEIEEAVQIDGASVWQKLRYVTIPMMRSTISTVAILVITGTFKIFEIVQQLTNGGPNHISETLITYSYSATFTNGEYGYGMSLATVTFFISLVVIAIYFGLSKERGRKEVS
ncbi:MAG: sugar ABC transporter permease [Oscillospiraceae bacterium]|nr:sugar ABC transporter permease [Oscillospiraceae bacterium]